jgi:hypothetical protein
MRNLAIDPDHHYCRCGALCEQTTTQCRKCRDRLGWYRRKAWRVKRDRYRPVLAVASMEEVITR